MATSLPRYPGTLAGSNSWLKRLAFVRVVERAALPHRVPWSGCRSRSRSSVPNAARRSRRRRCPTSGHWCASRCFWHRPRQSSPFWWPALCSHGAGSSVHTHPHPHPRLWRSRPRSPSGLCPWQSLRPTSPWRHSFRHPPPNCRPPSHPRQHATGCCACHPSGPHCGVRPGPVAGILMYISRFPSRWLPVAIRTTRSNTKTANQER